MLKIKFVFVITTSSRDRSGNCYSYTRMIDTASGAQVVFYGEASEYASICSLLRLDYSQVVYTQRVIGKREFNTLTKGVNYGTAKDFVAAMAAEKKRIARAMRDAASK